MGGALAHSSRIRVDLPEAQHGRSRLRDCTSVKIGRLRSARKKAVGHWFPRTLAMAVQLRASCTSTLNVLPKQRIQDDVAFFRSRISGDDDVDFAGQHEVRYAMLVQ